MEKIFIFKVGGKVIDDSEHLKKFLKDFAEIDAKKLLIHGGGKWVSDMSDRLGLKVNMRDGRRITDRDTLEVVKMILPGVANKNIVSLLQRYGCNALGLTGADGNMIKSIKRPIKNGIDFGYVGDVTEVNVVQLDIILQAGFVPVFTALTHDGNGQLLNTNADTIASSLAISLSSVYEVDLFYCLEKTGVLKDVFDEDSIIKSINSENYKDLKEKGVIHSGMIPKIDNAFDAIKKGVFKVHICHYKDVERIPKGDMDIGTLISG